MEHDGLAGGAGVGELGFEALALQGQVGLAPDAVQTDLADEIKYLTIR